MAEKRVVTADPNYTVPLLLEGKEVQSDVTFPVISPTSQKELWKSSSATLEHVKTATSAAQAAFPKWSKMKPAAKRDIFMKAADIIDARAVETGATSPFADGFNVPKTADMLRDVAGRLSTITGSIPTCESEGTSAFIVKEPLGTVLAIAPW
jgi:acyl-CoA reductase-like NAD-dependent aldehyde dehydrogenase